MKTLLLLFILSLVSPVYSWLYIPKIEDIVRAQRHIDWWGIAHHWWENTKLAWWHDYLAFTRLHEVNIWDSLSINWEIYTSIFSITMNKYEFLESIQDNNDLRVLYTCIDWSDHYLFVILTPVK